MPCRSPLIPLLCLAGLLHSHALPEVLGCKYTVRDFGFIHLAGPAYELCVVTDGPEIDQTVLDQIRSAFDRSNVRVMHLDRAERGDHPAVQALSDESGTQFVLHHASRHPLILRQREQTTPVEEIAKQTLRSPLRDRFVNEALSTFAYILLVEGEDASVNRQYAAATSRAIELLRSVESELPRELIGRIQTVPLPLAEREQERVTLWALGLSELRTRDPALAVIYGRAKRAGSPLTGDPADPIAILRQLVTIGQSCECETARDWFNEPHLPHTWAADMRQKAFDILGFDPSSPMVRAEAVRILQRGPMENNANVQHKTEDDAASMLFGYREIQIGEPVLAESQGANDDDGQDIPESRDEIERIVAKARAGGDIKPGDALQDQDGVSDGRESLSVAHDGKDLAGKRFQFHVDEAEVEYTLPPWALILGGIVVAGLVGGASAFFLKRRST